MYNIDNQNKEHGFIALTATLITVAVIAFIITSMSIQSIDETLVSSAYKNAVSARYKASACADKMLLELSNASSYDEVTEYTNLTVDDGSFECEVILLEKDNPTASTTMIRTVGTSSTDGGEYVSKLQLTVSTTTPTVEIDTWVENATSF
jgi:hypothetical protein